METLDRLITTELAPAVLENLTQTEIQALTYRLDEVSDQIRITLKHAPFSGENNDILEQKIQGYQCAFIRLMDVLAHFIQQIESAGSVTNSEHSLRIYHFAIKSLESLLSFIEQHLSKYFSVDEKVPEVYVQHSRDIFKAQLLEIEPFLRSCILDEQLIEIAIEPIKSFIEQKEYSYSYRQLMYLKELVPLLHNLKKMHKNGCAYSALSEKLFYLNFNSIDFINHFTARIEANVKCIETAESKIEQLSWHLKEVSQMHTKPDVALTTMPSVKEKIRDWLVEEIKHYKRITSYDSMIGLDMEASDQPTNWTWTGSKTDLIELLYALYYNNCFNNGKVTLKQIADFFERSLDVQLGDFYRVWQHIRIRKNRTQFLDQLKKLLIGKMEEADD